MKHTLPELPYSYDALEPYVDKETMTIHHTKHHAAYVNNLNAALENYPELQEKTLHELLTSLDSLPQDVYWAVRNNGGGHYNHTLFWNTMGQSHGSDPEGELREKLDEAFGSLDSFKELFAKAAMQRFGSGWAWLVKDNNGKLSVVSTANQDTPLSDGLKPLLGLDVWEHAYYLKYNNRRADYVDAWWSVVNWQIVAKRYEEA
ncbi:superoxide dismutase [Pseudobacteroides cellulosolvens]|uniref:Superoxide dismutase n=1 Tax=Pseudobacteroides cellulosolvens ATCC 35603 = DSM 2933 TaxID=398512 RepID=A0A0L6JKE7_9FIRM|nr:superoxide dismutase [Pseudobacteroides cellulosolvens]KNY26244.1 Superoxide dismutase [Pseudobacteroides cellulosolvens ATCC 35603 = DSM 2933]